ncbi:hypothetical protein ERX27_05395 [Macrococcus brunensis]|uniref:Uncharacterized protein n=1 Tax=Macrococcus brunensis TaxID=198483 RepID=A0A4R6BEA8_9STAP|nr:hypothetical protein ERX27_05395 [Macrococcus brunensis]
MEITFSSSFFTTQNYLCPRLFTVSFVGGIQFVGLLAPQLARILAGSKFYQHVLMSSVIGSIIVVLSDLLGRTLFLPLEVPAGVFTAAIGAPFFMYLLFKKRQTV